VTAGVLELKHDGGELGGIEFATSGEVADVIVLAEDAAETAAGEEDGAGAVGADEGALFTKVGAEGGDAGLATGTAEAVLVGAAVNIHHFILV